MSTPEFTKSETWKLEGETFNVEVKHWSRKDVNKWNVYIYLFPKFPRFEKSTEGLGVELPIQFNWGNSYCHWDRDKEGEVAYKKYGGDYEHINQERFEKYSTREDAYQVFNDAIEYFEILTSIEATN